MTAPKPKRRPKPKRKPGESSPVPPGRDPSWRSEGWQPDFDVASLVDYVSDVILASTRDAIKGGRRLDGNVQRALLTTGQQGKRARKGKRPGILGWTGRRKNLPDKIRRGKMRVEGVTRASGPVQRGGTGPTVGEPTRARVLIRPGKDHRLYVAREAKRGVAFFDDDGAVKALVDDAIKVWLKAALAGTPPEPDTSEHDADQVR